MSSETYGIEKMLIMLVYKFHSHMGLITMIPHHSYDTVLRDGDNDGT